MRGGFTLIEILIMVAIIGVLMAAAVVNVASGREAANAKAAARGVAQMCHYANALALLRQRPVVLTYLGGRIEVQMSGDAPQSAAGKPAAPIYLNDVNGSPAATPETPDEPEEPEGPKGASAKGTGDGEPGMGEKAGMFFTRRILDPEELAKEDAERTFEGVVFEAEVTGDEGEEIDELTKRSLENQAEALVAGRAKIRAWSNVSGEIDPNKKDEDDTDADEKKPARVVFETNGNCSPHRVTVKNASEGKEDEVLMVIEVARTGKVTICDEDDDGARNAKGRRRK